MSFIGYIPYEDASDDLKRLYDRYGGKTKTPSNVVRIASYNPQAMETHVKYYHAIMFQKSPISRHQREMIAVVVSAINDCHYWVHHHWNALHSLGGVDQSLKEQLVNDYKSANITDSDKAILDYAVKITTNPATITQMDIDKLLSNGFDKQGVHDIAQVACYFNYVNRLADSLGIEIED